MKVLSVTTLPIYLPFNKAPVPFGDALEGVTCTAAAPGVFTAPGYAPVNGDLIALSYTNGGSLPAPLAFGTIGQYPNFVGNSSPNPVGLAAAAYYVVSASGDTFSVSATKGGSAITTTTTGSNLVLHLLSGQVDGVTLPFKPGYTVVAENNTGSSITLQGAPDSGQAAAGTNTYNPPAGPGAFVTLATVPAGGAVEVVLSLDWIKVASGGPLILQQN